MTKINIELDTTEIIEAVRKDVVNGLSDYVSDQIDNIDWDMMVRDYGNVDTIIEDHIYNNDIVDKDWVEDELSKVHRDIRDEVLSDIRDEIFGAKEIESMIYHATASLQDQIMSMGAEVDYLHEKYTELYNKSLAGRFITITEWLRALPSKLRRTR